VRLVSRDVAFASFDPGAEGALLAWMMGPTACWPVRPWAMVPITRDAGGADLAARICREHSVRVIVVEDQYLGRQSRNFQTTKKLILTSGIVLGRILETCEIDDVVFALASTWQTGLPKHPDSKERARRHAERLLPGWLRMSPTGFRSGCADALGLADWFSVAGVR
jgi:hypothetical protein